MQLDSLEALRQARRARQVLEAVPEPQTSNCLGWYGHLLRGQQIVAPKELDETLQRRAP